MTITEITNLKEWFRIGSQLFYRLGKDDIPLTEYCFVIECNSPWNRERLDKKLREFIDSLNDNN